jgi:hypothetical protein
LAYHAPRKRDAEATITEMNVPDKQRVVSTARDVCERHPTTTKCRSVFDSILGLTTGRRDEKPSRVTIQEITPCEHGHRAARLSPPDGAEYGAITGDQRLFFPLAPPFDLTFPRDRAGTGLVLFRIDNPNRKPRCGVSGAMPAVMELFARGQVVGMADIQGVVSATRDIYEWHLTTMPSSSFSQQEVTIAIFGHRMACHEAWSFDALTSSLRLAADLLRTFDSLYGLP